MVVLSHPTGNANSRQALRAFFEHDMLLRFFTAVNWDNSSSWSRALPSQLLDQLRRRTFEEVPANLISTRPARELARAAFGRLGPSFLVNGKRAPFSYNRCAIAFDRWVAQRVGELSPSCVYGYATGALETFRAARRLGITTIYEVPTAHWDFMNRLLAEESELEPEFAATIPKIRTEPSWVARQDEELALADHVIVPCRYVLFTVPASTKSQPLHVVPYGAPDVTPGLRKHSTPGSPLRVLFVGNLSQAKGLSYVLKAIADIGRDVQFTIIGKRIAPCKPVDTALGQYRWIESIPHDTVLKEMEGHDVLVFPSLSEGFGLVMLEAMSRGMAVIATPNSGAPEVISDGLNGYIVPIRSTDEIVEKLRALAQDRELLHDISIAAMRRASEFGWDRYRTLLANTVRKLASRTEELANA